MILRTFCLTKCNCKGFAAKGKSYCRLSSIHSGLILYFWSFCLSFVSIVPMIHSKLGHIIIRNRFALKNTFQSCSRRGSSDRNIQSGVPNDIRQWCHDRKSIHRIVFSNGKSSFHQFAKHFKDWLKSGELVPSPHAASQEAFAKYPVGATITPPARTIECIVAVAVSPALATYSYSEKRDFWEESVFKPGLQDFAQWEHAAIAAGG